MEQIIKLKINVNIKKKKVAKLPSAFIYIYIKPRLLRGTIQPLIDRLDGPRSDFYMELDLSFAIEAQKLPYEGEELLRPSDTNIYLYIYL